MTAHSFTSTTAVCKPVSSNPKTPPALVARLQRARRIRLVENFTMLLSAEILCKYMSLFPHLELLVINTKDWTMCTAVRQDATDD